MNTTAMQRFIDSILYHDAHNLGIGVIETEKCRIWKLVVHFPEKHCFIAVNIPPMPSADFIRIARDIRACYTLGYAKSIAKYNKVSIKDILPSEYRTVLIHKGNLQD